MTRGCAALNCNNSTRKGFRLFQFPKLESQRKAWLKNSGLDVLVEAGRWSPHRNSCLCHVHFKTDWFEPAGEGKIRLKKLAVPTIFARNELRVEIPSPPKQLKYTQSILKKNFLNDSNNTATVTLNAESIKSCLKEEVEPNITNGVEDQKSTLGNDDSIIINLQSCDKNDLSECEKDSTLEPSIKEEAESLEENSEQPGSSKNSDCNESSGLFYPQPFCEDDIEKEIKEMLDSGSGVINEVKEALQDDPKQRNPLHRLLKQMLVLSQRQVRTVKAVRTKYKKNSRAAKRVNERLKQQLRTTNCICDRLNSFLNYDQIKLLTGTYKKIPKWSNNTVVKGLKLRLACGSSGYKELLKQNNPLPGLRTLNRKIEGFNFEPDMSDPQEPEIIYK